jgi:hypothetical protein
VIRSIVVRRLALLFPRQENPSIWRSGLLSYVGWRYCSRAKKTGKNHSYVKVFSCALSKLQHRHRLVKKRFVKKQKYVVFIHPVSARCSRQGSVSTTISSPRWSSALHRPPYPCPGASVLCSTSRCLPRCSCALLRPPAAPPPASKLHLWQSQNCPRVSAVPAPRHPRIITKNG